MIAVVGGGLIGSCVAFELSQAGYAVTVIDASHPGAAWRASAGLITPSNEQLSGPLLADALESLSLWPGFAARLEHVSGRSVSYRAATPGWADFLPGEGQVYPPGVREAALTGLEVLRGQGQALLLDGDPQRVPQYHPARRGFSLYALDRPDGVYVGATSRESWATTPDRRARRWLLAASGRLLGEERRVSAQMLGLRPCTRDGRPLLGPHPTLPGVYLATGHGRHGALLAPLSARRSLEWTAAWVRSRRDHAAVQRTVRA